MVGRSTPRFHQSSRGTGPGTPAPTTGHGLRGRCGLSSVDRLEGAFRWTPPSSPVFVPAGPIGRLYFLPPPDMLYQVRLQYALHIDATDKSSAYRQAVELLQKDPRAAIAKIEQADAPAKKRSLVGRVWHGE